MYWTTEQHGATRVLDSAAPIRYPDAWCLSWVWMEMFLKPCKLIRINHSGFHSLERAARNLHSSPMGSFAVYIPPTASQLCHVSYCWSSSGAWLAFKKNLASKIRLYGKFGNAILPKSVLVKKKICSTYTARFLFLFPSFCKVYVSRIHITTW